MDLALVAAVARAVVGWVFLVSGVLKARSRTWPAAAAAFGTPRPLVPVVPWAELVLGVLLVAQVGAPWTAGAALALLLCFTGVVAVRVARAEKVPCGCFGDASTKPVSGRTLVRNLVLCALALVGTLAA